MPTRAYAPEVGGPVSLSPAAIDACPSLERRLESADLIRLPWAKRSDPLETTDCAPFICFGLRAGPTHEISRLNLDGLTG
jgi:hypothetical protein